MSGDVLAVVGGKGGIGTTTTALNTAVALQNRGRETVVVDADLGMTNLSAMLDVSHEPRLHDVLAGKAPIDAAITTGPDGLAVLAGDRDLAAYAEAAPENLEVVLSQLARSYDAVVVDTGAGISREVTVPARTATACVVVTTPDDVAIGDARKMARLVDRVGGTVAGAVVTRADGDVDVTTVGDRLGQDVLAVVPEDAAADGTALLVLDAEESYAAQAYRQLAAKLADRLDAEREEAARS